MHQQPNPNVPGEMNDYQKPIYHGSPELKHSLKHEVWKQESCNSDVKCEWLTDDRWLELALAQIQREQQALLLQEVKIESKSLGAKAKEKTSRASRKKSSMKVSRDAKRPPLPSLAATHPALYRPQMAAPAHQQLLPSQLVHSSRESCDLQSFRPTTTAVLPGEIYNDPKGLAGFGEPDLPDPRPRMLKRDVRPDQCHVVSPSFMIPMPFGSLVELANYYDQQPRDTPSA